MPEEPPPSKPPYRTAWEPARLAVTPTAHASPAALRRELLHLRAQIDARNLPDRDEVIRVITQLTEARDWVRGWARPARGFFVTAALAFVGPVALAAVRLPNGTAWMLAAVALGLLAAAVAEFWANRWLDLLSEYDGAIADLRKALEKVPHEPDSSVVVAVRDENVHEHALTTAMIMARNSSAWGYSVQILADKTGVRLLQEREGKRDQYRFVPLSDAVGFEAHYINADEIDQYLRTRVRVAIDEVEGDTDADPEHTPHPGPSKRERE